MLPRTTGAMGKKKSIGIVAFGTLGDVFPIVGLAEALTKHCDVTVVTSAVYAKYFERKCCRVVEVLSAERHGAAVDALDLSTREGVRRYLTDYLIAALSISIPALLSIEKKDPFDAFLGAGFINAGQWVAEILGKPYIRISLSPFSDKEVVLSEMCAQNGTARKTRMFLCRAALRLAGWYHYVTFVNKYLNPVRRRFGLGDYNSTNLFFEPYSALRIALYPAWLVPASSGSVPIHFTNFPLSDPSSEAVVRRTEAVLNRCGREPLVFVVSSGMSDVLRHIQYAYSLCSLTGVPGVFVHAGSAQFQDHSFKNLSLLEFADLSGLLPRARLVIHHGGIGTIAQSLLAGIPQLVRPAAFDQHDNAMRIARLNVGLGVKREHQFDVEYSAKLVEQLTSSAVVAEAVRACRSNVIRTNGVQDASACIVRYLEGAR